MFNEFCTTCEKKETCPFSHTRSANAKIIKDCKEYTPHELATGRRLPRTISDWAAVIHENAKAHGWYETPRQPGELLMLITCEAAEAMEEIRNGHAMTETYYDEKGKMQGVPSELADIVIRVMDMAEFYSIDLEAAIAEKHAYNVQRPYKHGGKLL